jgi:hypothetical protein
MDGIVPKVELRVDWWPSLGVVYIYGPQPATQPSLIRTNTRQDGITVDRQIGMGKFSGLEAQTAMTLEQVFRAWQDEAQRP